MKAKLFIFKAIAVIIFMILSNSIFSQNLVLTFTGKEDVSSDHVPLDSIFIRNTAQGVDTLLIGNDTVFELILTGNIESQLQSKEFKLIQNYPNPFKDKTTFDIIVGKEEELFIEARNILGQKLAEYSGEYKPGIHLFSFSGNQNSIYIISVTNNRTSESIKLVNSIQSNSNQHKITYLGYQPDNSSIKSSSAINYFREYFPYSPGDQLQFVGFSNGYQISVLYDTPEESTDYVFMFELPDTFVCGDSLLDKRDGKYYKTVQVGDQCWMAENLNIGERIDGSENQQDNQVFEKYSYNDNANNSSIYGGLYQWDEMMQYDTSRYMQGVCPEGWHLPTVAEWNKLIDYAGGPQNAGTELKMGGSTGFEALLGGYRNESGTFDGIDNETYFWASAQDGASLAYSNQLTQSTSSVSSGNISKTAGFSVRCVKGLAPIVKENVVVIDTTIYELISDSAELSQGIYKYEYNNKRKVNDIIVKDVIIGVTDGGYLRKVQELEDIPPFLTLLTTQATLEEIFQQAEFDLIVTADSSATSAFLSKIGKIKRQRGEVNYYTTDFDLVVEGDVDVKINNYALSFDPNVNLKLKIKNGIISTLEFSCGLVTQHEVEVEIVANEVNIMKGGSLLPSGPIPIGIFYFQLGPVPVIGALAFDLPWDLDISFGGQNTETMAYSNTNSVSAGLIYQEGKWSDYKNSSHEQEFESVSTELHDGQIGLSVGPELFLMLYGIAGPYVNVGPELKLECNEALPQKDRDAELSVGANVNAGVKVSIFGWTLAKYQIQFPIFKDFSLWRLPEEISAAGGNNQSGAPMEELPYPVIVKVVDNYGNGFPSIMVHFEITQGDGSLSENEVLTDEEGFAQTFWTLGPETGQNLMIASVFKADGSYITGSPVEFSADAVTGIAVVITAPVTDTTENTATCGGEVQEDGGNEVTARGVCWSTEPGPTTDDDYTIDGSGLGTFVSYITNLSPATDYYVRAYATNSEGTAYGANMEFSTESISTESLVAYYPFTGNANDESGNGYHGNVDGATLTTDRHGNQDNAYLFDIDDISIPSNAINNLPEGTVTAFIYLNQLNVQNAIIDKTQTNYKNYFQFIVDENNKLRVLITPLVARSNTELNANQWYHVAVTWDGINLKFYLNGVLDGTSPFTDGVIDAERQPYIGKVENNTAYMKGKIDEVRIYNYALTSSEIQTLSDMKKK